MLPQLYSFLYNVGVMSPTLSFKAGIITQFSNVIIDLLDPERETLNIMTLAITIMDISDEKDLDTYY